MFGHELHTLNFIIPLLKAKLVRIFALNIGIRIQTTTRNTYSKIFSKDYTKTTALERSIASKLALNDCKVHTLTL